MSTFRILLKKLAELTDKQGLKNFKQNLVGKQEWVPLGSRRVRGKRGGNRIMDYIMKTEDKFTPALVKAQRDTEQRYLKMFHAGKDRRTGGERRQPPRHVDN